MLEFDVKFDAIWLRSSRPLGGIEVPSRQNENGPVTFFATFHATSTSISGYFLFFPVEWNSVPSHVVCVFPYVVSVTSDAIEIRSVVNGALLQTTCWPEMTFISSKVSGHLPLTLSEHVAFKKCRQLSDENCLHSPFVRM